MKPITIFCPDYPTNGEDGALIILRQNNDAPNLYDANGYLWEFLGAQGSVGWWYSKERKMKAPEKPEFIGYEIG
jgi:hypothetical protein